VRRVCETIVAVEKQVSHIFNPVFPDYLNNGKIFRKKLLNVKRVFGFSVQHLSEIFLIVRTIQRGVVINVRRPSRKVTFY
jgi:hypothetical protein